MEDITFYVEKYPDGPTVVKGYSSDDPDWVFFRELTQTLSMSDCTDADVPLIVWRGQPIHYVGWQQGMLYEYRNSTGELVWSDCYPEFDH